MPSGSRVWRLCGCVAALAAALSLPQRAHAAVPADFFGVNAQGLFYTPSDGWDAQLAAMAAGGLELVRSDASWDMVEPRPPDPATGQHDYQWSQLDAEVASLSSHGLRWYPILDYSAPWAGEVSGDALSAPARTGDYVAWAQALAERYGRGGSFWAAHPELTPLPVTAYEVWNEPNAAHFWHPQADAPEAYADLYLATRAALRSVDPSARVVIGGLALANVDVSDPSEFVRRMYAHRPDLRRKVDAIAFHPYAPDVPGVEAILRKFRQKLDTVGAAGVPIEITEIGWPSPQFSDAARATNLAQLARDMPQSGCDVERFMPHTWLDRPSGEGSFGIANDDATLKPSGEAYLGAVRAMRQPGIDQADAPAAICSASAPRLQLRVLPDRSPPARLTVLARCPRGCRMEIVLMASRGSGSRELRVSRRSTRFTTRRQALRLRVSWRVRAHSRRLRVSVRAIDRAGRHTTRSRSIAVR
jgi:hypothetical protein